MKEIELLKSMWSARIRRKTKLIVPSVTYSNNNGSLNNGHWSFRVPYAFRDALDIRYDQRMRKKKPYMVWTQGPIIHFKEGDMLTQAIGNFAYQVQQSKPMSWDTDKNEMYQGCVTYERFLDVGGADSAFGSKTCSQMEFLKMLI